MRKKIVEYVFKILTRNKTINSTKKEEITYYIECFYTLITKLVVIIVISFLIGTWKETLLLMLFCTPLRAFGFGFHANSNRQCWILSSCMYLLTPFIINYLSLSKPVVFIIASLSAVVCSYFSPADTKKRPLINKKSRDMNRIKTILILIIYLVVISLTNKTISYCIMTSIILQTILVSPLIYKIFKQPYQNYKSYQQDFALDN